MAAGATADDEDDSDTTTAPPQVQANQSLAAPDVPENTPVSMPGAETPPALPGAQPAQPNAIQSQQSKGQIPTYPNQPKYDQAKLAKANTTLDLLNAMKPASRNDYMDWWEKQHGAINDHYDALQQQLGMKPSEDQPYSKKEKFAALLEFGLHLMKASAKPQQSQGAALTGTLSDSMDQMQQQHQAGIKAQQQKYDQNSNAIEAARTEEQKGIGTPLDAFKQQESMNKDRASELKDTAGAAKDINDLTAPPKSETPRSYIDKSGQQWERDFNPIDGTYGAWKKSMSGGQPLPATDPTRGSRGGAGRPSVYSEALSAYDARNPLPSNASAQQKFDHDQAALAYAKGGQQIDSKVYATARSQAARELGLPQNYDAGDNDGLSYADAIRERTGEIYDQLSRRSPALVPGPGTTSRMPGQPGAPSAFGVPPAHMLDGLKPGQARKINGGYWKLGIDGQPIRVDTSLAAP